MISNKDTKLIKSLQMKKCRMQEQKFVVEGAKNVLELLQSDLPIHMLYVTEDFHRKYAQKIVHEQLRVVVKASELKKKGFFSSNNSALAIATIPKHSELQVADASILAFDRIKDPGNLGTIIRIADWYGFAHVFCSTDSVDCFNPKVISATMGAFARVQVHYGDLKKWLPTCPTVYGATLEGDALHDFDFKSPAVLLFGNESTGIDTALKPLLTKEVKIKAYGGATESLNVAVATAIICDNYRRMIKI